MASSVFAGATIWSWRPNVSCVSLESARFRGHVVPIQRTRSARLRGKKVPWIWSAAHLIEGASAAGPPAHRLAAPADVQVVLLESRKWRGWGLALLWPSS